MTWETNVLQQLYLFFDNVLQCIIPPPFQEPLILDTLFSYDPAYPLTLRRKLLWLTLRVALICGHIHTHLEGSWAASLCRQTSVLEKQDSPCGIIWYWSVGSGQGGSLWCSSERGVSVWTYRTSSETLHFCLFFFLLPYVSVWEVIVKCHKQWCALALGLYLSAKNVILKQFVIKWTVSGQDRKYIEWTCNILLLWAAFKTQETRFVSKSK